MIHSRGETQLGTNREGKRKAPRPKLSVFTDREMMKRLRHERNDLDMRMEDLVNERLRLSFEAFPSLENLHPANSSI